MLRGNIPARIDDKGRLKIPNTFRALISEAHGREVFVTSLTGESVRVYPMPVWLEIEQKLAQAPSTLPARLKFLDRVNYYGQVVEFDVQGRLLIQPRLRASALMTGDVAVIDNGVVNGSATLVDRLSGIVRRVQTGFLYHYAFLMIVGLIALLGVFVLTR